MTTLTALNGAGDTTPDLVTVYTAGREGRNIFHDLIGGGQAIALVAPAPPAGELECLYTDAAAAHAAVLLHAEESLFTITDGDHPWLEFSYAIAGDVELEQDDTRRVWVVTIPYRESS